MLRLYSFVCHRRVDLLLGTSVCCLKIGGALGTTPLISGLNLGACTAMEQFIIGLLIYRTHLTHIDLRIWIVSHVGVGGRGGLLAFFLSVKELGW